MLKRFAGTSAGQVRQAPDCLLGHGACRTACIAASAPPPPAAPSAQAACCRLQLYSQASAALGALASHLAVAASGPYFLGAQPTSLGALPTSLLRSDRQAAASYYFRSCCPLNETGLCRRRTPVWCAGVPEGSSSCAPRASQKDRWQPRADCLRGPDLEPTLCHHCPLSSRL